MVTHEVALIDFGNASKKMERKKIGEYYEQKQ